MKSLKKAIMCLAVVVLMGANSLSAFATTYGNCSCKGTYHFYYKKLIYTEKTYHTVSYIHEHDVCTYMLDYYDIVGRCDKCGNISWVAQEVIPRDHSLPHN